MSIEKNTFLNKHILICPFSNSCILPKSEVICDFPCYKICPEYQLRGEKLKKSK
ncbi:MAG: hypothetical protein JXA99_00230 [Candidatus Lokiarchaeota archaeon]|nr:hypothetical protein [Candidatus Lokiarchaeota archaeon]